MIRHVAEVLVLIFAAFTFGSALGWGLQRWTNRRLNRAGRNEPIAAPPRAARPAGASPATTAGMLVPVLAGWERIDAGVDGAEGGDSHSRRRRIQTSFQAARDRRERPEPSRVSSAPGGAINGRPRDGGGFYDLDLPTVPYVPRKALPAPSRPPTLSGANGASLPVVRPAVRPDDVWNDEPARPARRPSALRPKAEATDPGDSDDPWMAPPTGWPIDLPPRRTTAPSASRKALALNGGRKRSPRAPMTIAQGRNLPAVAGPRSDQAWIEAARAADGDKAPGRALAPVVRPTYRTDGRKPPCFDTPPSSRDNLRRIRGVGQGFEKRLNELGVYRLDQIAEWSEAEQQWVSDQLGFHGRVEREGWVDQAARLLRLRDAGGVLAVETEVAADS